MGLKSVDLLNKPKTIFTLRIEHGKRYKRHTDDIKE